MTKAQFDKLKPATRRMKMAEDIIKTLALAKTKRFQPMRGAYCLFNIEEADEGGFTGKGNTQLRDLLPKFEKHCEACAMGALLLSHVRLVNHLTVKEADNRFDGNYINIQDEKIIKVLGGSFSGNDLRVIEAAFEGRNTGYHHLPDEAEENCHRWLVLIPDATKRLRAIMKNIIKHGGEFDITDLPKKQVSRAAE